MRPSALLLLCLALLGATPALANDVTVLRGASAPPPSPVVVQTVVVPEVVYVPTYYPGYDFYPGYFYPGYFFQDRRSFRQHASATGMTHSRR